jgi:hypothetical protein
MPALGFNPLQNTFAPSTDLSILEDGEGDGKGGSCSEPKGQSQDGGGRQCTTAARESRFGTELGRLARSLGAQNSSEEGAGASEPLLWRVELGPDEALFVPAGFPHQV